MLYLTPSILKHDFLISTILIYAVLGMLDTKTKRILVKIYNLTLNVADVGSLVICIRYEVLVTCKKFARFNMSFNRL